MVFGLSTVPATFQKVMNTTLAPLLLHCVLVVFYDIRVYNRSYEEHLCHLQVPVVDSRSLANEAFQVSICSVPT
jgi:hypothetical protein